MPPSFIRVPALADGHEHNYERNWPTMPGGKPTKQSNVNPTAPIYIVSGAAGCNELHEPFTRSQPPRSAFRSNNFGYSRMWVYNSSHIHWQQVIMDPGTYDATTGTRKPFFEGVPAEGTVIDDTWIIQPSHGPFDLERAAAEANATAAKGYAAGVTKDHFFGWDNPNFGWKTEATAQASVSAFSNVKWIEEFRTEYGDGEWRKTEMEKLKAFNQAFGDHNKVVHGEERRQPQWEDTHEDGSSDGSFEAPDAHADWQAPAGGWTW